MPDVAMIIAIDGPAASGKGTLARKLAAHYGLPHLDTGLIYRAVARRMLDLGLPLTDAVQAEAVARSLDKAALDDPRLRERSAGEAASVVSVHAGMRKALLDFQRTFANQPGGAVLDGRDIGTVVCPQATVKLFVIASAEERARRRQKELLDRGEATDYDAILEDVRRRDERDANRAEAPLKAAPDAVEIDTSILSPEQSFQTALAIVEQRSGTRHTEHNKI